LTNVDAREQLQRIERLLVDLEVRGNIIDQDGGVDARPYIDAAISFFVAAWAVRDWILDDDEQNQTLKPAALDRIIETFPALLACADVANRAKHPRLHKGGRSKPFSAAGHWFRTTIEEGPPGPSRTLVQTRDWLVNIGLGRTLAHGASIDEARKLPRQSEIPARELARQTVQAWKTIFKTVGLSLPISGNPLTLPPPPDQRRRRRK
jgi:hypothetical protein